MVSKYIDVVARAKRALRLASLLLVPLCACGEEAPPVEPQPAPEDAQMKAVLDQLAALGGKPIETLSPQEARQQPSAADAVKALLMSRGQSTTPEPVAKVEDRGAVGPPLNQPVRIYYPEGSGPFPVLVYYHGGGWVLGDINTYDATPRALTNLARCVVVSAEYRKAPEAKFPAAHEDALAAYQWVRDNAASFGGDPSRIAVGGESAGGNLAAGVAIMARERGIALPIAQLLIYPVASYAMDTVSYLENKSARPLNREMMRWFFDKYLRGPQDGSDVRIALSSLQDAVGLPPAIVITAEIDPLRTEGRAYAERLVEAEVPVTVRNYEGVTHEFFGMGAVLDKAKEAQRLAAEGLIAAFKK